MSYFPLKEKQAAEILGVKPRTLSVWRYQKKGPAYLRLPNGTIRYEADALLSWLGIDLQHRFAALRDWFDSDFEKQRAELDKIDQGEVPKDGKT